eukprot:3499215-Pyramimonas_sp.AAC.1
MAGSGISRRSSTSMFQKTWRHDLHAFCQMLDKRHEIYSTWTLMVYSLAMASDTLSLWPMWTMGV